MASKLDRDVQQILAAVAPARGSRNRASVITVRFTPAERRRVNRVAAKLSAAHGSRVSTNALCLQAIMGRLDELERSLGVKASERDGPAPPKAPKVKSRRRMGDAD